MCDRCEELEWLVAELTTPPETVSDELVSYGCALSKARLRILGRLTQKFGEVVPFSALHAAMYQDHLLDAPESIINILRVQVCKLRDTLDTSGVPIRIRSKWGVGYYAERVQ